MPTALGTIASHRSVTSTGPIPTTGLQGWWDADDASTFSYSGGSVVSQWRDKSGNNRHANTVGAVQPTVVPGSMNARPTLYLTGVPCYMEIAAFASAYTTAELFAVLKVKTIAGSGARSQMFSQWGTNGEIGWYPFIGGALYENWGTAERPLVGTVNSETLLAPHVYNIRVAPGSLTALVNGATVGSPAATVAFRSSSPHRFGNDFGNDPPDGYIAEVVMYDRVLSTVERQQVESYLHTKWLDPTGGQFPLTGLAGWWDAGDAASITASAGAVSQWNDKSGSARHLTQTVEANKPTTGSRTINGRNALDFTDDRLTATTGITHPWIVFLVVKSDVGPSGEYKCVIAGSGTNSCFVNSEAPSGQWYVQGNGYMFFNRYRDTNTHLITVVADASLAYTSFYDGVQTATLNTSNNWGFGPLCVGAFPDGAMPWDGLIAEVIIYNRDLSTVERQQVESYLKTKWGTP